MTDDDRIFTDDAKMLPFALVFAVLFALIVGAGVWLGVAR